MRYIKTFRGRGHASFKLFLAHIKMLRKDLTLITRQNREGITIEFGILLSYIIGHRLTGCIVIFYFASAKIILKSSSHDLQNHLNQRG